MTVITDEQGRRCDERCYDAKFRFCRCACGGKNHGRGLAHALREVRLDELIVEHDEGGEA